MNSQIMDMNSKARNYLKVSEAFYVPVDQAYSSNDLVVESHSMHAGHEGNCNGPRVFKSTKSIRYQLIDCNKCGFIHALPKPSDEELSRFYRKKFYNQQRKSDYFAKQKNQLAWWNIVFEQRLQRLEELLGRKGRIVDVGCGPGFFLNYARDAGWDVIGLEPSRDAANYAIEEFSLTIIQDEISTLWNKDIGLSVDIVYSHGVIEHLKDPLSYLEKSKAILDGPGLIFTSAANDFNIYQALAIKALGIDPWFIIPPEHLNYFTVESLVLAHEKFGYKIRDLRTSFPIDMFLMMGEDYVSNSELGPSFHSMRANYEKNLLTFGFGNLLSEIQRFNAKMGIGRQTEIIGEVL